MISDPDLAALCAGTYAPDGLVQWDRFEPGNNVRGICYGIKRVDGVDVIAFRGSQSFLDWRRDLDAWANPFTHFQLGPVHFGFLTGMLDIWSDLKPRLGSQVVLTGHSLGAARASILAGLMLTGGIAPLARVVFGEPQPGFQALADLLAPVPGRSYCNGDDKGHDMITDVPYFIPPLLKYVHPTPLIHLQATPTESHISDFGVFGYHHIQLYVQAMKENAS